MLEKNNDFIDFNLGVSYFLRELDIQTKEGADLSILDSKVIRIKGFIDDKKIIGGYKFKLMMYLIQHSMNVREWDEATNIALSLKKSMEKGYI